MRSTFVRTASLLLALVLLPAPAVQAQSANAPYVCIESSLGTFCIQLFDDVAPATVANFLNYVRSGKFNGTFFHRSIPGFVIQGGGYSFTDSAGVVEVAKDPAVVNEFRRSNLRGTIAMAKMGNDPNSATSEWFINLGDNSANLDNQNGGFTVFGQVVGEGMTVVDEMIARTPRDLSLSLGGAFTDVPLMKVDTQLSADDFITIRRAFEADPDNLPGLNLLPETTGIFSGIAFAVPLVYRGQLYRVAFDLASVPPSYEFVPRTTQIVLMKDFGQEKATLAGNQMFIPSMLYGTAVLRNLVLDLIDPATLRFKVVGYELDTGD